MDIDPDGTLHLTSACTPPEANSSMVMAWLPAGPARLYSALRTLMLTGSSSPEPRTVHRAVTAPAATAASLHQGRWPPVSSRCEVESALAGSNSRDLVLTGYSSPEPNMVHGAARTVASL